MAGDFYENATFSPLIAKKVQDIHATFFCNRKFASNMTGCVRLKVVYISKSGISNLVVLYLESMSSKETYFLIKMDIFSEF